MCYFSVEHPGRGDSVRFRKLREERKNMESRLKWTMFDDYWIDYRIKTVRRWFSPKKLSEIPAGAYGSLVYDKELGRYRIYMEQPVSLEKNDQRQLVMMESADMVHFSVPVPVYDGEGGLHGSTVLYDENEPDPSRRYKYCGMTRYSERKNIKPPEKHGGDLSVDLAYSADGIHFVRDTGHPAHDRNSDTLNKLMYNPCTGEYTLFFRATHTDRRIACKTSKDLIHWTEPRIILQPSPVYNDGYTALQQYGMTAGWFDGIFYGLVMLYKASMEIGDYSRMSGYMEPELVYSFDGKEFLHTTGKTLIERPEAPEPGCIQLYPLDMVESADGEYYCIYLQGKNQMHATVENVARLTKMNNEHGVFPAGLIYRIRKDRFCGLECTEYGGSVITKRFRLTRPDLELNINASCGYARFAMVDWNGDPFPGFSLEECIPMEYEDSVCHRPQWKEHSLDELTGKKVRIRVELNSATLHCISAAARPQSDEQITSYADPTGYPEA